MQSLVDGMEDVIEFREIDMSKDSAMRAKYGIQVAPTTVILDAAGNQVGIFEGYTGESRPLQEAIDRAVSP